MSTINYFLKFFWLVGLLSACQMTPVEDLSRASSLPSSPSSTLTSTLAKTEPSQSQPQAIFSQLLPKLKAQTELPIRLPAYIPESDGSLTIYAILETANVSKYEIQLAFTEDCNGASVCRLGSTSAEAIAPKSSVLTGEAVALANGITGYFTDATCGANCSDATLTWEQNSVRYTVGIKAGKVTTLVKMANSAISASVSLANAGD
ncbi:hypothetical protein [Pleurocapsa sp. FMAR1]|uniref:hypothetical protein n=1 Tax=Pleurocapsa sp. FMAR1 TaxID=3040204 RepID=UPI0029C6BC0E|nr:hypothetical protein [Pleurocapsa sp. FMAR1]